VAIDVTAGERERGSLEPLLLNPVSPEAIALGKWGVVALASATVVGLTLLGFLGAMALLRNETLAALLQFGVAEVGLFLLILLPFCAFIAALDMVAAIYGRSFKEAQTLISYITLLIQLTPVLCLLLAVRDADWQLWIPGMAQMMLLLRVVRGATVSGLQLLLPALVAAALTLLCLRIQAWLLRQEKIVFGR
jgi:sodium transport system permease protein